MKAAKSRETERNRRQVSSTDRHFAVILKEITGKRGEKDAAARLRLFVEHGALVSCGWHCRKWAIDRAIERQSRDLEAVAKLADLLTSDAGDHSATVEHFEEIRRELRDASETATILNRLLAREATSPTGLLQHPKTAVRILRAWLSLEIKLRPDERGLLAGLRDRLTCAAERREIDLRGLGI